MGRKQALRPYCGSDAASEADQGYRHFFPMASFIYDERAPRPNVPSIGLGRGLRRRDIPIGSAGMASTVGLADARLLHALGWGMLLLQLEFRLGCGNGTICAVSRERW
jgi:hypothetical protein